MTEIVITSLISIMIAVFVTRYFSARMALKWRYSRRRVIDPIRGKYPDGVETFLDGKKIDNLVEWKIAIWNSGNRPIRASDFIGNNSITIKFPGSDILKAGAPEASREVVGGAVDLSCNRIEISDINILDSQDYLMFRCYGRLEDPEAELSMKHRPEISADVARIPGGARYDGDTLGASRFDRILFSFAGLMYFGFGGGLAVAGLVKITGDSKIKRINDVIEGLDLPTILAWPAVPIGILSALAGALIFIAMIVSFFGSVPKAVRKTFEQEIRMSLSITRLIKRI